MGSSTTFPRNTTPTTANGSGSELTCGPSAIHQRVTTNPLQYGPTCHTPCATSQTQLFRTLLLEGVRHSLRGIYYAELNRCVGITVVAYDVDPRTTTTTRDPDFVPSFPSKVANNRKHSEGSRARYQQTEIRVLRHRSLALSYLRRASRVPWIGSRRTTTARQSRSVYFGASTISSCAHGCGLRTREREIPSERAELGEKVQQTPLFTRWWWRFVKDS